MKFKAWMSRWSISSFIQRLSRWVQKASTLMLSEAIFLLLDCFKLRRKFEPAQKGQKLEFNSVFIVTKKEIIYWKTRPYDTNFLRKAVIRNLTNGLFLHKKKHRCMHWILYPKTVIIFMLCASGVTGKAGLVDWNRRFCKVIFLLCSCNFLLNFSEVRAIWWQVQLFQAI